MKPRFNTSNLNQRFKANRGKHCGSSSQKKFKKAASVGKVMAHLFYYSEGVIMIDYPKKNVSEIRKPKEKIKSNRRGKMRVGVLLLLDNVPNHLSSFCFLKSDPACEVFIKKNKKNNGICCGRVLWGPGCHLPGWDCNFWVVLDQVHWSQGELYWKIVKNWLVALISST